VITAADLLRPVAPMYDHTDGRHKRKYPADKDGKRWCKSCGWAALAKFVKGDGHSGLRRECQDCRKREQRDTETET
jgi:hypothetical protein